MTACEICWRRAQSDALLRGGSTADRYRERIEAEERRPTHRPTTLDDEES